MEDAGSTDAEVMAWAVAKVMNKYEASPRRGEDPHQISDVLEHMNGYSSLGTEILRRRGITGAVVVENAQGVRYIVVCGPPSRRPPGSVRSALRGLYRWARNLLFPGRRTVRPRVEWWTWIKASQYYVVPNFHEKISYISDLVMEEIREAYPIPEDADLREFRSGIGREKGQAYFDFASEALDYAENLERAMYSQGILCAPEVGIANFTDCPRVSNRLGDQAVEKDLGETPVPTLGRDDVDDIAITIGYADHLQRRCAELESRLHDPVIPERRKADLKHQLTERRQEAHEALQRARAVPIQDLARTISHLRAEQRRHEYIPRS